MYKIIKGYRQDGQASERCFNIESSEPLTAEELQLLRWVLAETFEPDQFAWETFYKNDSGRLVEIGPRLNFATSKSTNAVAICHAMELTKITRVEVSRRHILDPGENRQDFIAKNHDRMTECEYAQPLTTFDTGIVPESVQIVPVLTEGAQALETANKKLGLGMDAWDINYYVELFCKVLKRNPTDVELFQLGNANSEHSRHWFFKGKQIIDGVEMPHTLLELIQSALKVNPSNSLIAFNDNSSAIRGYNIWTIIPQNPGKCCRFEKRRVLYHVLYTAETHNWPSGKAPIPGAATGTGGRTRDVRDTGRGATKIAGGVGFCVGALHIPGYEISGDGNPSWPDPDDLAKPLDILLGMAQGAWGYGNELGEPVIFGFTRGCDLRLPNGERRAWHKPIMFTGGIGQLDDSHIKKETPQKDMLIIHIGGPAYRIGMGGGAASSMQHGQNTQELDFKAVQRGDAQMGNKGDRVIRACVELGPENPILSAHDQGAGGPGNVLTEITDPQGGVVYLKKITLGDPTLSDAEIWCAEFQECDGLLIWQDRLPQFLEICLRERLNCEIVGEVTGDGRIVVYGTKDENVPVVDLPLDKILGNMPQKTFYSSTIPKKVKALELPEGMSLLQLLKVVFQQLSVGSKEGLLNRVDRSVSGLVARQQYCGPAMLPVADVAVVAQSHFGLTGGAVAIGEQPMKILVNEEAGARIAVGEMITNMAAALISGLRDIKTSVNWMWAAKLPGEGAVMYRAMVALVNLIIDLQGAQPDGGKDSLTMSATAGGEIVKAPGQVVVSGYVTVPDVRRVLTPDIKYPGQSCLLHIDLGKGKRRLGGSALAQTFGQIGDCSPDIDAKTLCAGFLAMQKLQKRKLISAIHDISDGGLITAVLEMAFAGNCGLNLNQLAEVSGQDWVQTLFAEELGWVIEYENKDYPRIIKVLKQFGLADNTRIIGKTSCDSLITVGSILKAQMEDLRALWRETSFQLAALASNPECVAQERKITFRRNGFSNNVTFDYQWTAKDAGNLSRRNKPKLVVIREEGTNGDREMASAFYLAGFEVYDVTMTDLTSGRITLKDFVGIAFPGGFSFADVFDSAKGWAAVIKFNARVADEFAAFLSRTDTFVFGVCNGCQLMALLGIVPWRNIPTEKQPRFIKNTSGVFESRWTNLAIAPSNSIFLQGMEGSVLGCWAAHGEGRFHCPDDTIFQEIIAQDLAPITYNVEEPYLLATEDYPLNPNGSPKGIAGLISPLGTELAMMNHPERLFRPWQWPHWTKNLPQGKVSPWFQLFRNARRWCAQS